MAMKVGLQIFSVKNAFKENPEQTLKEISKAGYKYIELANKLANIAPISSGFKISPKELKRMADGEGITITGAHISPEDGSHENRDAFYRNDNNIKEILGYLKAVGATDFVIPIDFFPTKDYLLKRCEVYNHIGELCKKEDMRLVYHNHYHEFQLFGQDSMFDLIMQNTNPSLMQIEIDVFWTIRGLFDPISKIHQYKERIVSIHQKDFPLSQIDNFNVWKVLDQNKPIDWEMFQAIKNPDYFIEVGDGILKTQDVIDAGNECNIPIIFVEQDETTMTEIKSIQRSMENFRKMRGLDLS